MAYGRHLVCMCINNVPAWQLPAGKCIPIFLVLCYREELSREVGSSPVLYCYSYTETLAAYNRSTPTPSNVHAYIYARRVYLWHSSLDEIAPCKCLHHQVSLKHSQKPLLIIDIYSTGLGNLDMGEALHNPGCCAAIILHSLATCNSCSPSSSLSILHKMSSANKLSNILQ